MVLAGMVGLCLIAVVTPRCFADDVDDLKLRVEQLERAVEELRRLVEQSNRQSPSSTGADAGSPFVGGSKPVSTAGSTQVGGGAAVTITIKSFKPAPQNDEAIGEAERLLAEMKKQDQQVATLEQQKTRLYDLYKELEERRRSGRSMSEEEYRRLCQENKNQRDDIVNRIARIVNDRNINRRKQEQANKRATPPGQMVEGVDASGQVYIVTTKLDCSKTLSVGATVSLVNLKVVSTDPSGTHGTVDKVERVK
jgi:cell division septum initiation protein DivIVA